MSTHRNLIVLSLAAFLTMIGVGMIVAILPQRMLALSDTLGRVSLLASLFAAAYLIAQLPAGRCADRFGTKPVIIAGYLTCGIAGIVFAQAESSNALLFGRFIQGAGEAPVWALGPAFLAAAYPQAKGWAIGTYNACFHAGLTLGPLLGLLAFPTGTGGLPFLVHATLCISAGFLVLFGLERRRQPLPQATKAQSPSWRELAGLFSARGPALALSGGSLYGAGYGLFTSILPASLAQSQGFDNQSIGLFFVLFYISISLAQLLVGPLSDRWGRQRFLSSGMGFAALGMASFVWLNGWTTYLALGLASMGMGGFWVASLAYLSDQVPDNLKGTASGSYFLAWGAGYFLIPPMIGSIADQFSDVTAFTLYASLLCAHSATTGLLALRGRRGKRTA